jgi:hypothetical protein
MRKFLKGIVAIDMHAILNIHYFATSLDVIKCRRSCVIQGHVYNITFMTYYYLKCHDTQRSMWEEYRCVYIMLLRLKPYSFT